MEVEEQQEQQEDRGDAVDEDVVTIIVGNTRPHDLWLVTTS